MLKGKRGNSIRVISSIAGSCLLLLGLYFLNKKDFLYGGAIGIIGILLITISIFPYIKATSI